MCLYSMYNHISDFRVSIIFGILTFVDNKHLYEYTSCKSLEEMIGNKKQSNIFVINKTKYITIICYLFIIVEHLKYFY